MNKKNANHDTYNLKPGCISEYGHVSMKGIPNSFTDKRNKKNGALIQRRKYNKYGDAFVDMDAPHVNVSYPHTHNIYNGKRDTDHNHLNKKEKREYYKAQKKRRGPYVKK